MLCVPPNKLTDMNGIPSSSFLGQYNVPQSRLERYFDPMPPRPVKLLSKPIHALVPPTKDLTSPGYHNQIDSAACKTSTWTYKHVSPRHGAIPVQEKVTRFRPERKERRPIHRLQWKDGEWERNFAFDRDYLDLDIRSQFGGSELSPQHAMKRIISLTEKLQYKDAASLVNRLPTVTFKSIASELPMDVLIDAMPQSIPLIETMYSKALDSGPLSFGPTKVLRPENVAWQMVRFFAQQEECLTGDIRWEFCGPFVTSCKKILKVIAHSDPQIRKMLKQKRKQLEKAIEGMGHHGLVGTSDQSLQSLHDALKLEFERVVKSYNQALEKLHELSLSNKAQRNISHGPAPVQASHQRQLSITQEEIQQRLIKNKTLLNVVEPTLGNHSLDVLLGILQRRIEYDKESLFQFTQLRKEAKEIEVNAVVAPILMRYSHGCEQVLEMMREICEEEGFPWQDSLEDDDSSDVSGYHSDSDSAIMMSGNSPFVSKHARFNFLTRSVRERSNIGIRRALPFSTTNHPSTPPNLSCSASSASSDSHSQASGPDTASPAENTLDKESSVTVKSSKAGKQDDGRSALKQEVELLRAEVTKARQTILHMQERERKLKEKLNPKNSILKKTNDVDRRLDESLTDGSRNALIQGFGNLYAQSRLEALDALDALLVLKDAEELKSKLLFSVVVLAFRSVNATATWIREEVRRTLHTPVLINGHDHHLEQLENSVSTYISSTVNIYDLSRNVEEVCQQIWATLYDYPILKTCEGLLKYIKECVRVAWGLVNLNPPYIIEYETRGFNKELHIRFHSSNFSSETIGTYIWPALLEGPGGSSIHKGVVIT